MLLVRSSMSFSGGLPAALAGHGIANLVGRGNKSCRGFVRVFINCQRVLCVMWVVVVVHVIEQWELNTKNKKKTKITVALSRGIDDHESRVPQSTLLVNVRSRLSSVRWLREAWWLRNIRRKYSYFLITAPWERREQFWYWSSSS